MTPHTNYEGLGPRGDRIQGPIGKKGIGGKKGPRKKLRGPLGLKKRKEREREREKPVAQRHQMVSGSLALLFIGLELPLGSRAAAPIGDKVL